MQRREGGGAVRKKPCGFKESQSFTCFVVWRKMLVGLKFLFCFIFYFFIGEDRKRLKEKVLVFTITLLERSRTFSIFCKTIFVLE